MTFSVHSAAGARLAIATIIRAAGDRRPNASGQSTTRTWPTKEQEHDDPTNVPGLRSTSRLCVHRLSDPCPHAPCPHRPLRPLLPHMCIRGVRSPRSSVRYRRYPISHRFRPRHRHRPMTIERRFLAARLRVASYGPSRFKCWDHAGTTYAAFFQPLMNTVTPWPAILLYGSSIGYFRIGRPPHDP